MQLLIPIPQHRHLVAGPPVVTLREIPGVPLDGHILVGLPTPTSQGEGATVAGGGGGGLGLGLGLSLGLGLRMGFGGGRLLPATFEAGLLVLFGGLGRGRLGGLGGGGAPWPSRCRTG